MEHWQSHYEESIMIDYYYDNDNDYVNCELLIMIKITIIILIMIMIIACAREMKNICCGLNCSRPGETNSIFLQLYRISEDEYMYYRFLRRPKICLRILHLLCP
jgi:hypothetical protein